VTCGRGVAERVDPAVFQDYANYHRHLRIEDYATQTSSRSNSTGSRIDPSAGSASIRKQRPVRLVILKARREGVSTYAEPLRL
jgi:hypothetical protein